jgi:eukaryotic-like serine/threonine-protein kinase
MTNDLKNQILFGRYQVLSMIGQGGMGSVYKALDLEDQQIVALKTIQIKKDYTEKSLMRFRKEFSTMQKFSHPNIVSSYHYHEMDEGFAGFSMEYVEGRDLDSIIYKEDQFLSLEDKITLGLQIAEGLSLAHQEGVIHRDLKPANILVVKNQDYRLTTKITDFGLAQEESEGIDVSKSNNQIGTAYYMAPEQHRGESLTFRTDIYCYGILLFELFTGKRPFDGTTPFSLFLAHVSKGIPEPKVFNSEIPSWLSTMIEICAEKESRHRYQNMEEVLTLFRSRMEAKKRFSVSRLFNF